MLSVAQAVHHPETPGSASKHSALGHSWSSERPNMLKRRKTEPDCSIADKKPAKSCIENLTKQFNFNNQEITLTAIPKKNNQNDFKELLHGQIKISPIKDMKERMRAQDEKKESDRIPTNIPPVVLSFLEHSEEIQLTKVGSNENVKLVNQNDIGNNCSRTKESDRTADCEDKLVETIEEKSNFVNSNSIAELSEVTIEPCPNLSKSTTQSKLQKACDLLKKKENLVNKTFVTSSFNEIFDANLKVTSVEENQLFDYNSKSEFAEAIPEQSFDTLHYIRSNSPPFDEETDHNVPVSTVSDYEPFNVGISCDRFYSSNKDKPHYTAGFSNPPGENRCWINATLQALFTLPVINRLDTLDMPECSKLMASLINVQTFWRKGSIGNHSFDQVFYTFKEELSALDKLYSSKAQQDVSEFVMNLLNFIKTEFETILSKKSHNNENIPNNDQDALRRLQSSTNDTNKRLPLAKISASARQLRSNHQATLNIKTNASPMNSKSDNQIEVNSNPIDEYFSLYMIENFKCEGCLKQRQTTVENLMLFIDLPSEDHGSSATLTDMINTTYALEHRNMTCESCKHNMHSIETKFKKIPKILTVQVKRYEMTNDGIITKKCTLVEIPKLLKLDSLVINNCQDFSHFPTYEPICIISHIGDNIDSGHYISFVKHQDQWFYYDDMNVKVVSADEVFKCIQNNAYVIFFQDTELSQNVDIAIDQKN